MTKSTLGIDTNTQSTFFMPFLHLRNFLTAVLQIFYKHQPNILLFYNFFKKFLLPFGRVLHAILAKIS